MQKSNLIADGSVKTLTLTLEKWVLVSEKLNEKVYKKTIYVFYVFIVEIERAKGRKSRF